MAFSLPLAFLDPSHSNTFVFIWIPIIVQYFRKFFSHQGQSGHARIELNVPEFIQVLCSTIYLTIVFVLSSSNEIDQLLLLFVLSALSVLSSFCTFVQLKSSKEKFLDAEASLAPTLVSHWYFQIFTLFLSLDLHRKFVVHGMFYDRSYIQGVNRAHAFLHAIAFSSTYPCQSVNGWVGDSFRFRR